MRFEALKNYFANIVLLVVRSVYGLILPHMIILSYGSAVNGAASVATQIVGCIQLVEMGIYSASIVALYEPLARKDRHGTEATMVSIRSFYVKIGWIFSLATMLVALVFPMWSSGEVGYLTMFGLIVTIACANAIRYFASGKYRALLQADNKLYIVFLTESLGYVIQIVLSVICIQNMMPIVAVKASIVVSTACEAIILVLYAHRRFGRFNYKAHPRKDALIRQRDIMIHQVATLIIMNVDIIVISVAFDLSLASVYAVYNMIALLLAGLVDAMTASVTAHFGQRIALGDGAGLQRLYARFEYIYIPACVWLYVCMAVLLLPFVHLYVAGANDADYFNLGLAYLFAISGLLRAFQKPALTVIAAKGDYRQTRAILVVQAAVKIVLSALLLTWGLCGLLVATSIAWAIGIITFRVYASTDMAISGSRNTFARMTVYGLVGFGVMLCVQEFLVPLFQMDSYTNWALCALVVASSIAFVLAIVMGAERLVRALRKRRDMSNG
ncbi:lipopolysaccharide biosynthesis protein [Adlercreutzia sp. ZJ154]|uniref:lipopolysaccharide biosynthesis protein n=1 Tax=Adlercreutzia sp. ZJ154 TaxID=2709790 RepID=UPI00197FAA2D|nr:hypothetical protein [Adlercreutzia sp. ZJ154]